jgi:uncharacterized YigZ family protein
MLDEYHTITEASESEIKVKGSKFIGTASPVTSKEEAEKFLSAVSKKYFDATHHCFAYRCGLEDQTVLRYSDDSEPSGTAGKPIYQTIVGHGLTDVMVVVTRYFGGTKLGTGGLARAYGDSADATIRQAQIITKIVYGQVHFRFPYEETKAVMQLVHVLHGRVVENIYDDDVAMKVDVRLGALDDFKKRLTDSTRGRATILTGMQK